MPPPRKGSGFFVLASLKGGRNGFDPPTLVPDDQALEVLNMDFYKGALGRKRPGSDSLPLAGGTPFTTISALFRHVPPGSDETLAELWAVDNGNIIHRMAVGLGFTDVTPKDVPTGTASATRARDFNGKLYFLYANGASRVNLWDPALAQIRRAGLAAPSGIPTATKAAGSVTDTRTYETAVVVKSGGIVQRRSELSAASASVSLSAQQATVTIVGAPGEGETHWELYGASTDGVYHFISDTAIANATITENNATLTGSLAPLVGTNSLIPDATLLAVDGSRILFARHRTTTSLSSRVWFTPPFVNPGDDERVPTLTVQNNYFDLNPNDGDFITAIDGPMQGSMFVWKRHQFWKLTPTGDNLAPYQTLQINRTIGCLDDRSVVFATDEYGLPTVYWWSLEGPFRYGSQGLQYMGRDIEDIWPTINLTASTPVHGVYHRQLHQIWWWVATGTNNDPDTMVIFDTILGHAQYYTVGDAPPTAGVRRGWVKWTGDLANARCSCIFARSIGATMGLIQAPYAGFTGSQVKLFRGDSATARDDGGTVFQSQISTKHYQLAGKTQYFDLGQPILQAKASNGTTLQVQAVPDWSLEPAVSQTVTLTAEKLETRVWRKAEKVLLAHVKTVQFLIGDPVGRGASWELDELVVPVQPDEAVSY